MDHEGVTLESCVTRTRDKDALRRYKIVNAITRTNLKEFWCPTLTCNCNGPTRCFLSTRCALHSLRCMLKI